MWLVAGMVDHWFGYGVDLVCLYVAVLVVLYGGGHAHGGQAACNSD